MKMEVTPDIVQMEPEVLMAISLYKEKRSTIADAINALMNDLGSYKVDAKHARMIMDDYIPKTEKLSEEIELMREE